MRLALDPFTGKAKCRTCGAAIVWALKDDGRRMAVDQEPSSRGQWVVWWLELGSVQPDRSGRITSEVELNVTHRRAFSERYFALPGVDEGRILRTSHASTCAGRVSPPDDPGIGRRQLRLFNGGKR